MTRPRQSRETARFLPFFLLPLLGHCSRRSTPIPPAPRMNYLPLNAAEVALQGATTAALFGSLSYAASVVAAPMVRAVAAPSKAPFTPWQSASEISKSEIARGGVRLHEIDL